MRLRWGRSLILFFLAITIVTGTVFGLLYFSRPQTASADAKSKPDNDQLENLKALPYTVWSRKDAHPQLRGVLLHDRKSVYPGFNFYTNSENKVFLSDMNGKIVHTWTIPDQRQCEHAELLPNGDILAVCVAKALVKLDWHSNVLWIRKRGVHHDIALTPDGNIYAIHRGKFIPYKSRRVAFDQILLLSPDGMELDHWSTYEQLEKLKKYHALSRLDIADVTNSADNSIYDYYHMNRIQLLPETKLSSTDRRFRAGNLLLCLRNVSLIFILAQDTREILWHWGEGVLEYPHMPTMLENGHILIFDNGVKRKYSRVIEVDPQSKKIVWEYKGEPPETFFSEYRGSAQRLPNGNTLICESDNGHVFEINPQGTKVWEFWNPELRDGKRKQLYRFMRIEESKVRQILSLN